MVFIHTLKISYSDRRRTMKNIFIRKGLFLPLLAIIYALIGISASYGGNIMVSPGKFDHFAVQLPEKVRAGEGFMVKLYAYDAHDNLITNFAETGKDFKILISGSAQAQPSMLKASAFVGGAAGISITGKKAESITLSVFESGGTVPVMTKDVTILPNKLDHFFIQSPQSITAGNKFDVKIIARDAFDNPVTDAEIENRNIKVTFSGTTGFKIVNPALLFRNGVGIATLTAEKIGESAIEVYDSATGSKGVSHSVKVVPAGLSHFNVYAPKEAVAGEPFEITISALDAFDNPIDNYASSGKGVNISSTGQAKTSPSFISQSDFKNGQAVVRLKYEKAEDISIAVTENNKAQQGRSTAIRINPSAPENFAVVTPNRAVAGQAFKVKIEAYDRFNNLVKNYNLIGNDVYLNVTGTGMLSPNMVSASDFMNGVASVEVIYNKAESFTITASMAAKRGDKKITVKTSKEDARAFKAPEVTKKPSAALLVPKPAEKMKAEKQVVEKKSAPKAKQKPEKTKKLAAVIKKHKEKKEPARVMGKVFEVNKVSVIEAKNKAMIIMSLKVPNVDLEYKDRVESARGKEWIVLNLKPAVNKTKRLWRFKSAFINEIRIEEDPILARVLNVRIETLSKQFTFDVNRVKDSLVISITHLPAN